MGVCNACVDASVWVDYTSKSFCRVHFLEFVEKRIRKFLRLNKLINIKESYFLIKDSENKFLVLSYFLDKIFNNRLDYSLIDSESVQSNLGSDNFIFASSLDDESGVFLDFFLQGSKFNSSPIKPLCLVSNSELSVLGEILGIDLKIKESSLNSLIKDDAQLLFSLRKSQEFIQKRIKK